MRTARIAFAVLVAAGSALASQPLETETARLLPAGMFKVEVVGEFQTSDTGRERAFPLVLEYGITPRTELTIEPVFGTSIRPRGAAAVSGAGDLEVTLTHLLAAERDAMPAFAVAGEIKFPTARNRQIGTGKTDYTVWGIASKQFDRFAVHANLGYTVAGSPAGTNLSNIIDYAVAGELHLSPRFDAVGELIGNTSSTGDTAEGTPGPNVPPEAAGAETSALVGVRYFVRPALALAIGVSYDNNHAKLLRAGVTYRFGGR